MDNVTRGTINELEVIAALLKDGMQVYRNVSARGPIDLIAYDPQGDLFIVMDVKTIPKKVVQTEFAGHSLQIAILKNGKVLFTKAQLIEEDLVNMADLYPEEVS